MKVFTPHAIAVCLLTSFAIAPGPAWAGECKKIHADLVEYSTTEGCNPGLSSCFLGMVDGNHGLTGTTHFRGDSSVPESPATSPNFIIYSGPFEYRTEHGTLTMRETGATTRGPNGVVTAYQEIVGATGRFAGASGHFFVSGTKEGGMVTTFVNGEVCYPE